MRVVKTGSDFKTGSTPDIASLIRATADPGYLLSSANFGLVVETTGDVRRAVVEVVRGRNAY